MLLSTGSTSKLVCSDYWLIKIRLFHGDWHENGAISARAINVALLGNCRHANII
jgi:hypothetical protein